jgi:hypothetical protein
MVITREVVDILASRHGRTSCNDNNLANASGGWTGYYERETGKKEITYPRCNRCYLLDNIGMDTNSLAFNIEILLSFKFKDD